MKNKLPAIAILLFLFFPLISKAQLYVGVYHSGITGQIGIGTNNEKKVFGELRFLAPDRLVSDWGFEGIGSYNFLTSDLINAHLGLMLGYSGDAALGIPAGLTIKPFPALSNLGILLEATPYLWSSDLYLRANIGLKYRFNKKE